MRRLFSGWLPAAVAIVVWGVTFASTRMLLADFSALEILVLRFSLAWAALWVFSACPWRGRYGNAGSGAAGVARRVDCIRDVAAVVG